MSATRSRQAATARIASIAKACVRYGSLASMVLLRRLHWPGSSASAPLRSNGDFAGSACVRCMQEQFAPHNEKRPPRWAFRNAQEESVAERQSAVAARVVRAVEAVLADRLAAERGRT